MRARVVHRLLLPASCLALVVALASGALASGPAATQGTAKTIYVSVLDAEGTPVTDMTAADFAVREDTVDREIVSAALTTEPLSIAMLVDTTDGAEDYVADIRAGFKAFVQDVLAKSPQSQLSLWEFGQAAIRIRDFTSDAAALDKDIGRIFPKPRAPSVLLEALYDTSQALAKRPGPRRAIVALNVEPVDEQSRQEPKKINEALLKSRAQLWSLSVQKGSLKNPQRDLVLNTLVRNAGGQREFIVAQSAIESYLRRYAAALTSQYALTYTRPSGTANVVQTGARRQGVKIVTGIFAPQ